MKFLLNRLGDTLFIWKSHKEEYVWWVHNNHLFTKSTSRRIQAYGRTFIYYLYITYPRTFQGYGGNLKGWFALIFYFRVIWNYMFSFACQRFELLVGLSSELKYPWKDNSYIHAFITFEFFLIKQLQQYILSHIFNEITRKYICIFLSLIIWIIDFLQFY